MKSSMYFRTYLSKGKETKNIKYHDYFKRKQGGII